MKINYRRKDGYVIYSDLEYYTEVSKLDTGYFWTKDIELAYIFNTKEKALKLKKEEFPSLKTFKILRTSDLD